MTQSSSLKRTCSVCGLEKSISSFLRWNTREGAIYGTVCANCRGQPQTPSKPGIEEESTHATTGIRIGAKQKVEMAKRRRTERDRFQEDSHTQKQHREEIIETSEKQAKQTEHDQKIREQINPNPVITRQPFLGRKPDTQPATGSESPQKATESREHMQDKRIRDQKGLFIQREQVNKTRVQKQVRERTFLLRKQKTDAIQRLKRWLTQSPQRQDTLQKLFKSTEKTDLAKPSQTEDQTLIQFVKKTWGSSGSES